MRLVERDEQAAGAVLRRRGGGGSDDERRDEHGEDQASETHAAINPAEEPSMRLGGACARQATGARA